MCLINFPAVSSFLSAFLDSIIAGIMVLFVVAAAIFVTRGFSQWCSSVTERFPSCGVASVMKIKDEPDIDAAGFFLEMQTAQFGIWTCLISWTMLLVCVRHAPFSLSFLCIFAFAFLFTGFGSQETIRVPRAGKHHRLHGQRAVPIRGSVVRLSQRLTSHSLTLLYTE